MFEFSIGLLFLVIGELIFYITAMQAFNFGTSGVIVFIFIARFTTVGFFISKSYEEEITSEQYHELDFFYLMKVPDNMNLVCNSFKEQGTKEHLHWLPIEELDNYHVYPEFFKSKLD